MAKNLEISWHWIGYIRRIRAPQMLFFGYDTNMPRYEWIRWTGINLDVLGEVTAHVHFTCSPRFFDYQAYEGASRAEINGL